MKRRPTRPLILANYADMVGGGEHGVINLARGLASAGEEPSVVLPEEGGLSRLLGEEIPVFTSPQPTLRPSGWLDLAGAIRRLTEIARRTGARIIHSNGLRGAFLGWRTGLPLVHHARVPVRDPLPDRLILARAEMVIANSRATARRFRGIVPEERIRIVHNAIDPVRLAGGDGRAMREGLGMDEDAFVVLVLGRLTPEKGHRLILEAAETLKREIPGFVLLLVGDDSTAEGERLRRDYPPGRDLVYASHLDDVSGALAAADIVAVPSIHEGFGRSALEAMAAGIPVVASDVGGLPEVIGETVGEARAGILVPPEPSAFAGAIARLAGDPDERRRMGEEGKKRAAGFTIERMAGDVIGIYDEVLERRRARLA